MCVDGVSQGADHDIYNACHMCLPNGGIMITGDVVEFHLIRERHTGQTNRELVSEMCVYTVPFVVELIDEHKSGTSDAIQKAIEMIANRVDPVQSRFVRTVGNIV